MIRAFLTFLLIGCTTLMWGQNDQQRKLEQRKAQIQKEIREIENILQKEKKKEKTVLSDIYDKNTKIKLSQQLINTTQKQTRLLNDDMYLNQLKMNKLNRELSVLKEDYANMIVKSYKSRSEQSRIMFVLSSNSFLQAYKRMQYMKQYASFRKIQGDEIHVKMQELDSLNRKLTVQKEEKQKLLTESEKEKQALEKERLEQEKLVKAIQKDKKKYASEINKKKKESQEIDRKIDKMVKDAIAAANRKALAEAKTPEAKKEIASAAKAAPNKIVLTKEGKLVADSFTANKGKLPWPVHEGYISSGFGEHASPLDNKIMIKNSGVEITTSPNADVRAVFSGEVGEIQILPGSGNKIVYIRHGNYITVYFNLKSISVQSGDKVSTKQSIGKVATSPSGKTVLKFFVLQNTSYLNPQSWITQ